MNTTLKMKLKWMDSKSVYDTSGVRYFFGLGFLTFARLPACPLARLLVCWFEFILNVENLIFFDSCI